MNSLLMLGAAVYFVYAVINIGKRPGLFAAANLLSFGLSVFFGPFGVIAGTISIAAGLAKLIARPELQRIHRCEYALLLWLVACLLSLFTTPNLDVTGLYIGWLMIGTMGTYVYARAYFDHPRFFEDLILGGLFLTAVCTIQIVQMTQEAGILGDTAKMSHVGLAILPELCLVGILSYLIFHRGHSRPVTALLLIYVVAVLLPLITALGTRSVALSVGIVFLLLLGLRAWHGSIAKVLVTCAVGVVGVVAVIAILWSEIEMTKVGILISFGLDRLTSGLAEGDVQGDPSTNLRLGGYGQAVEIFLRHPIFGNGVGAFGYMADDYAGAYPHNLFLELLVQNGVFGVVVFLFFLVPPALKGLRDALRKPYSWTAIFCFALFTSTFIRHQISMSITTGKFLFLTLGCFVGRMVLEKSTASENKVVAPSPALPH